MWQLAPGARLDITEPASLLAVDWSRESYCLIAGGIGITPILGAAQALVRRGADVTLHYAVRSRAEAAYLDDLAALLGDRLVVHAGDEGKRLDLDALFAALPKGTLATPGSALAVRFPISATRPSAPAARCRPRRSACV
jgi:vanillate O-demethylase ferredoxin subunit